jgi:hypothetical protein
MRSESFAGRRLGDLARLLLPEHAGHAEVGFLGEGDVVQLGLRRLPERAREDARRGQIARGDRPARALEEALVAVAQLAREDNLALGVDAQVRREGVEALPVTRAGDLGRRAGPALQDHLSRVLAGGVERDVTGVADARVARDP